MKRALILVMDSLGIGASADAHLYGDQGANTLGHIADQCAQGLADADGVRQGPLNIPNLTRLGMAAAQTDSSGHALAGVEDTTKINAVYGYAIEQSKDKDTPSGHWEMAGVPVPFKWGTFPKTVPCFPDDLIEAFIEQAGLPGILGNCHASGTEIIKALGEEHIKTGKPICYTSADSVFQIAAHETHFGLDRLLEISAIAKKLVDELNITRVIARPFIGTDAASFQRTSNRKDLTTPPIEDTLLDHLSAEGGQVISVGKISDIFAGRGIGHCVKGKNNMALFDAMLDCYKQAEDNTLIFVNFVDFDSHYGHRRNVIGYAKALEEFDARLPELTALMEANQAHSDDIALITADHGCDPTFPGSDHTREHVPVLFFGPKIIAKNTGARSSFADMGQTLAHHFAIGALKHGQLINLY
ncbi:phosphopentomutase [Marinicella litoralis]|uniref:Phosphopentomutase n=1 Tax=Marinicella litoralis TaxID=644220 RepID=A0A4R6XI73_9GAMM|nr:phosphopentomutase [Marinicella litoralis]TDR16853.1 phosphopentomutase [Marinicella litoralis]